LLIFSRRYTPIAADTDHLWSELGIGVHRRLLFLKPETCDLKLAPGVKSVRQNLDVATDGEVESLAGGVRPGIWWLPAADSAWRLS
jgi:hypothetical protein